MADPTPTSKEKEPQVGVNLRRCENPSSADAELVTLHGKKIKVTDEEFAVMLEKAGGFKTRVAKQLGITVSAVCHRIQRSEYLRDACRTIEETIVDLAEAGLVQAAQRGEPWAITFILKCKGRKRGWIERQDVVFGGEMDAPPPPFVIELHDPAFVEAERKRQEAEIARTIDAMAVDVSAADAAKLAETSGSTGQPLTDGAANGSTVAPTGATKLPETGTGAAVSAPAAKKGQPSAPAAEQPHRPRTPSEAAAMRRAQEAKGRAAAPAQQGDRRSFAVPAAFPRR